MAKKKTQGWLDSYEYGGQAGYTDVPFNYNSAWGGQFQLGGNVYPVNYVPQAQDGILTNIYSKWPALKHLGNVTVKPDESFTREKTGMGDIEFFSPDLPQVSYPNGYVAQHPGPGTYGILYNPTTNDEQNIRLDMLHGMTQADPKYKRLRNRFERAVKHSDIYDEMNHWYNIDKEKGNAEDGRERWMDNYTDGQLRTLLFEGDRSKQNYSDEEANQLLSHPRIKNKFDKLNNYLQKGEFGGSIPGSTGFTYARTNSPAPSNGPYAKKTKASAQNGMSFYQHGLDWKPKTISKNGGWLDEYIPEAQKGFVIPYARDLARQMNYSTDREQVVAPIIERIKAEQDIAKRQAEDKRQYVGQGKASTKESEARRIRLNQQNTAGLPNVQIDQFGNTSAINPNMTYTGQPANFMGERQQKGYEHIMGALEAAGYAEGLAELGALGYSALRNRLAKSSLIPIAETSAVEVPKTPWSIQEMPGLHLKSTMSNGPISKIVEHKTGLVNVDQALAIIGKESGGADKVALVKQGLGENIPKKMDYNEFRKVVQDQLIPLERKFVEHSSNYGLGRIGYPSAKRKSYDFAIDASKRQIAQAEEWAQINKDLPEDFHRLNNEVLQDARKNLEKNLNEAKNLPIENQTLLLSNENEFGFGSSAHSNPDETLGHIHFLRDAENPDVLTVTQLQSDAFQGTNRTMPKKIIDGKVTKGLSQEERIKRSLDRMEQLQERNKAVLNKMKTEGVDESGVPVQDYQIKQFEDLVNTQERLNKLKKAELKNFSQKQLLDKNHQERYIQELVNYAGERGDINKIRLPTSETAAKVQGYTKGTGQINTESLSPEELKIVESFGYSPEQNTILKKYAEQPKLIKKLFGQEPKTVTDKLGNSWYEFDIPEGFKGTKGEIKAFKQGGVIKDNRGQWAHPGKITEIDSNNITMHGVPYPVLGIGKDGQQILMQPGQDYKFNKGPVTEFPMAQDGKQLPPIYTDDPDLVEDYNDSLHTFLAGQENLRKLKSAGFKEVSTLSPKQYEDYLNNKNAEYKSTFSYNKDNIFPIQYAINDPSSGSGYSYKYLNLKAAPEDTKLRKNNTIYINFPIQFKELISPANFKYTTGELKKERNTKTINGKLTEDSGWKVTKNTMQKHEEDRSTRGLLPLTTKPVQPYILGKPPEPTLTKQVTHIDPISFGTMSSPGLRTIQHPNIQMSGSVPQGQYRTSYYDPQMKNWNERAFMTQQESDRFANEMSQRGYPGAYGNVTQTKKVNKKSNGGWLDAYK